MKKYHRKFFQCLLLSFITHIIIVLTLNWFFDLNNSKISPRLVSKKKTFLKLKTVGKKNGLKKVFTDPSLMKNKKKYKKIKKQLAFKDLLHTINKNQKIKAGKTVVQKEQELAIKRKKQKEKLIQKQFIQSRILKESSSSPSAKKALRENNFNMHIEPPEGLNQDELNKLEMVFYSFYRRVYKNYITSFISNFNKLEGQRPKLRNALRTSRHRLKAKVTYDKNGNINAIKIFKSSQNDDIHLLFENVLTKMNSLSNPPKELLSLSTEFNIFYDLNIN